MSGVINSIFGGSSSGSGAQATSSQSQADPRVTQAYLDNITRTNNAITRLPSQQYASFTPDQQMAFNMLRQNATSGVGQNVAMAGINATADAAGYTPTNISGGSFLNSNIAGYMNPYLQNVASNTLSDLGRARQMALQDNAASAIKNKAFGGSRQGVVEAETNRNFFDVANRSLADLYSSGYTAATGLAGQDLARDLQAQQSNQQANLSGATLRLSAGNQLGDLAQAYQNLGLRDAAALQGVGDQEQALLNQRANADRENLLMALQLGNAAVGTSPSGFSTTSTSTGNTQGKGLWETIFTAGK